MTRIKSNQEKRKTRHNRVRSKIKGTAQCPRLSVFRSNRHLFVQLIDDISGKTLVAASDSEIKVKEKKSKESKISLAQNVGQNIAQKASLHNISRAVFDRGGYVYHGIVKAVAEGARTGGLKF